MKKIIAILSAVLVLFCAALPAAAETQNPSPSGEVYYTVVVVNGFGEPKTVPAGGTVTITSDSSKGTFEYWEIYLLSDKTTPAVAGVDYEIISGSLTSGNLVIRPFKDLYIVGHYKNEQGGGSGSDEPQSESPKTGESLWLWLLLLSVGVSITAAKCKY